MMICCCRNIVDDDDDEILMHSYHAERKKSSLLPSLLAPTFAVSCKPIWSASASSALLNGNWNSTFVKYPESHWAIRAPASGKTAHMKAKGTRTRRSMRCRLLICSACKTKINQ